MFTRPLNRKQILLVEDNDDFRQTLALALEYHHYTVFQAEHGQVALRTLERITPDVIISDINMPVMNGIEFYKALRRIERLTPVPFMFLTANDTSDEIRLGRDLGVEDYLIKPVDPDTLIGAINARLLRAAEVEIAQVGRAYAETVDLLANTIESRDAYTHGHVERVARYAHALGEALGWMPEHLRKLDFGARLHDIGKIIVPDHILNKPEPLTPAEWETMKQHPQAGARILRGITHLQDTLPYILHHHERWNGSGYPHGLRGKDIPVEGRLLAVVDVYDALTTARPYHPALPRLDAARFLKTHAGELFDPNLVAVFLHLLETRAIS